MEYSGGDHTHGTTVPVHVPVEHLQAVYEFLAQIMAGKGDALMQSSPTTVADEAYPFMAWTHEDIARLAQAPIRPLVRALLDRVSEAPGATVTFEELRAETGQSFGEARGDLSSFTHLVKKRFGRRNWPFQVAFDTQGRAAYSIEPRWAEVGIWWRAATKEQS